MGGGQRILFMRKGSRSTKAEDGGQLSIHRYLPGQGAEEIQQRAFLHMHPTAIGLMPMFQAGSGEQTLVCKCTWALYL